MNCKSFRLNHVPPTSAASEAANRDKAVAARSPHRTQSAEAMSDLQFSEGDLKWPPKLRTTQLTSSTFLLRQLIGWSRRESRGKRARAPKEGISLLFVRHRRRRSLGAQSIPRPKGPCTYDVRTEGGEGFKNWPNLRINSTDRLREMRTRGLYNSKKFADTMYMAPKDDDSINGAHPLSSQASFLP